MHQPTTLERIRCNHWKDQHRGGEEIMAKSPHKDDASPLLKHENFVKFFLSTDCAVFVLHDSYRTRNSLSFLPAAAAPAT